MRIKIYSAGAMVCLLSAVFLSGCGKKAEQSPVSNSFQKKLIDKNLMSQLDSVYANNNYRFINENRATDMPDSKEFWYTIEELEGYIAFAKKEAENKNQKLTGIKIKMGQYPAKGQYDSRLEPQLYGYQTVYLVPTVISVDGNAAAKSSAEKDSQLKGEEIEGVPGMDFSSATPPY
ncbi:MAG: hypothetical protein ACXWB5_01235 [Kaistella sp.]